MDTNCLQLIREYIEEIPAGTVFAKADLQGFGSDDAIRMAFYRLVKRGYCGRLAPSVYYKPGNVAPDPWEVGKAIARNCGWNVVPGQEHSQAALGLLDEVPEQVVLTSTGFSKIYQFSCCQNVYFKHTKAKFLREMSAEAAMVVNGLLGLRGLEVSEDLLRNISRKLSAEQKGKILEEKHLAPVWMQEYLDVIGDC